MKKGGADIDRVLQEVRDHDRVSAKKLSKELNVSQEMLIDWANALEESGLISVDYPFFGSPTLISEASEEKPIRELPGPSKRPSMIIAGVLIIVAIGILIQFTGLFDFRVVLGMGEEITLSPAVAPTTLAPQVITKRFNSETQSATYTATLAYVDPEPERFEVYIDKGRIRVDKGQEYALFDGRKYYLVDPELSSAEEIDKEDFEWEARDILPQTYISMLRGDMTSGSQSVVGGLSCTEFFLRNGDMLCIWLEEGFPLLYSSKAYSVSFHNININANIDDSLFGI
jgi:hypothetical protein